MIESVTHVNADLNRIRAPARQRRERMASAEAARRFAAQLHLWSQSVTNALGLTTSSERTDEQLTRLLVLLEKLEGRFGEHERSIGYIPSRREEVHDRFTTHRQQLLDTQQRRARTPGDATRRILVSI